MSSRSFLTGIIAVLALAACDLRQPAGPTITAGNTSTIVVSVRNDRGLSPTSVIFATDTGGTRIDLLDATTGALVQTQVTDRTGRVSFVGLNPGTYSARVNRALANDSTTFQGPSSVLINVPAGRGDSSTIFRTRLGSRITGAITASFTNDSGLRTVRFPGVQVRIFGQTGGTTAAPVFATEAFDTVTTDAAGIFSFPVGATAGAYQLRFTPGVTAGLSAALRLGGSPTGRTLGQETIVVRTGVNTNTTVNLNQVFQLPSRITGTAFRDLNNDGVRAATGEGLVTGDIVILQLRAGSATGRVIATATANTATGAYTFSSIAPGVYFITMDRVNSRFPSNPLGFTRSPAVMVTVPDETTTVTVAVPVPFGP